MNIQLSLLDRVEPLSEGRRVRTLRGKATPLEPPFVKRLVGDARALPLKPGAADLVVTSPPYWLKRDYGVAGQIGQEPTADLFVASLLECM